jgi:hypothetical protein
MARYHIRPSTEIPTVCYANGRCPFDDVSEHYSSFEAAMSAIGELQKNTRTVLDPTTGYALDSVDHAYALIREAFRRNEESSPRERFGKIYPKLLKPLQNDLAKLQLQMDVLQSELAIERAKNAPRDRESKATKETENPRTAVGLFDL